MSKSKNGSTANGTGYTIHVGGKEIPVEIERVKVSSLKLDLKNPRMHSELGLKTKNGGVTAKEMMEAIWAQNDTKQLFKQILNDGGLIEPPFVRANDVIAEGNRRRVCLDKILNDDEVAEQNGITAEIRKKFESIDIFRIPAGATEKDILCLLLDWHISAKKQWKKPDQVEIILRLFDNGMEVEELARRTRQSKSSIENRLGAYELLKKFRKKNPKSTPMVQSNMLNYYRHVQGNAVLREWIATEANFDLFTLWVEKNKIQEAKDLRKMLPEIIQDPAALADFTNDDELTVKAAHASHSLGKKSLFEVVAECARSLKEASYAEVVIFGKNAAKQHKLKKLEAAIAEFMANANKAGKQAAAEALFQ